MAPRKKPVVPSKSWQYTGPGSTSTYTTAMATASSYGGFDATRSPLHRSMATLVPGQDYDQDLDPMVLHRLWLDLHRLRGQARLHDSRTPVQCGVSVHHYQWKDGKIRFEDHEIDELVGGAVEAKMTNKGLDKPTLASRMRGCASVLYNVRIKKGKIAEARLAFKNYQITVADPSNQSFAKNAPCASRAWHSLSDTFTRELYNFLDRTPRQISVSLYKEARPEVEFLPNGEITTSIDYSLARLYLRGYRKIHGELVLGKWRRHVLVMNRSGTTTFVDEPKEPGW